MQMRYKANIADRHVIKSVAKFDETQIADMERMMEEFVNVVFQMAKENPKLLEGRVYSEGRVEVAK